MLTYIFYSHFYFIQEYFNAISRTRIESTKNILILQKKNILIQSVEQE